MKLQIIVKSNPLDHNNLFFFILKIYFCSIRASGREKDDFGLAQFSPNHYLSANKVSLYVKIKVFAGIWKTDPIFWPCSLLVLVLMIRIYAILLVSSKLSCLGFAHQQNYIPCFKKNCQKFDILDTTFYLKSKWTLSYYWLKYKLF